MAASKPFSTGALEKKLRELSPTMQSIQNLSTWILQYRRHCKAIVGVWFKELQKGSSNRKLTLLYVANDIIQNSKHKGPEFRLEFTRALPKAFQLVSKEKGSESLKKSVGHILSVWQERRVFDHDMITKLKTILSTGSSQSKRSKSESDVKRSSHSSSLEDSPNSGPTPSEAPPNNREPPQAEDLLKRMMSIDGDKSAANDMVTRQKIASFPPAIYDSQILSKISDKATADQLLSQIEEALEVLTSYTGRLEKELEERTDLQEQLDSFKWQQEQLLRQAKQKQKEYQSKLERGSAVREELKSHIASLPDFSTFPLSDPAATDGLAPLPSVGDLFS